MPRCQLHLPEHDGKLAIIHIPGLDVVANKTTSYRRFPWADVVRSGKDLCLQGASLIGKTFHASVKSTIDLVRDSTKKTALLR